MLKRLFTVFHQLSFKLHFVSVWETRIIISAVLPVKYLTFLAGYKWSILHKRHIWAADRYMQPCRTRSPVYGH